MFKNYFTDNNKTVNEWDTIRSFNSAHFLQI